MRFECTITLPPNLKGAVNIGFRQIIICLRNEAGYFGLAHASFERALSPFALLAVTT